MNIDEKTVDFVVLQKNRKMDEKREENRAKSQTSFFSCKTNWFLVFSFPLTRICKISFRLFFCSFLLKCNRTRCNLADVWCVHLHVVKAHWSLHSILLVEKKIFSDISRVAQFRIQRETLFYFGGKCGNFRLSSWALPKFIKCSEKRRQQNVECLHVDNKATFAGCNFKTFFSCLLIE